MRHQETIDRLTAEWRAEMKRAEESRELNAKSLAEGRFGAAAEYAMYAREHAKRADVIDAHICELECDCIKIAD